MVVAGTLNFQHDNTYNIVSAIQDTFEPLFPQVLVEAEIEPELQFLMNFFLMSEVKVVAGKLSRVKVRRPTKHHRFDVKVK